MSFSAEGTLVDGWSKLSLARTRSAFQKLLSATSRRYFVKSNVSINDTRARPRPPVRYFPSFLCHDVSQHDTRRPWELVHHDAKNTFPLEFGTEVTLEKIRWKMKRSSFLFIIYSDLYGTIIWWEENIIYYNRKKERIIE